MFKSISRMLSDSASKLMSQPGQMFSEAMSKVVGTSIKEGAAASKGRNGFRTKHLPDFVRYLEHIKNWGSYTVGQTKYPSSFSFKECRMADKQHQINAQQKRLRKNKIQLARFAQYAAA